MAKKTKNQSRKIQKPWVLTSDGKMAFGKRVVFPIMAVTVFSSVFVFFCVMLIVIAIYMVAVTDSYLGLVTVVMGVILMLLGFRIGRMAKEANSEYLKKFFAEINDRDF